MCDLANPWFNFVGLVYRLERGPETPDKRHWTSHDTKNIAHKTLQRRQRMPVNYPIGDGKLIRENEKPILTFQKDALRGLTGRQTNLSCNAVSVVGKPMAA